MKRSPPGHNTRRTSYLCVYRTGNEPRMSRGTLRIHITIRVLCSTIARPEPLLLPASRVWNVHECTSRAIKRLEIPFKSRLSFSARADHSSDDTELFRSFRTSSLPSTHPRHRHGYEPRFVLQTYRGKKDVSARTINRI